MRTKTIILGAIAALAVATVTVSAGNAPQRPAQGSVMSLVAASTALAKADRGEASAAVKTTSAVKTTTAEPAEKPEVEDEAEAPKGPVSAACQTAIDNLKALRQADIAEDVSEKAGQPSEDEAEDRAEAGQAEDKTEAGQFKTARMAVRAACLPQPSAACQAAIAGLKALRDADKTEDTSEKAGQSSAAPESAAAKAEDMAEAQQVRTALMAIRSACGEGERD